MSAPVKPMAPCVSVHDGPRCVGHVLAQGKRGYEAFDTDDKSHGIFATQLEAAAALGDGR
jgi:hypothetical protein